MIKHVITSFWGLNEEGAINQLGRENLVGLSLMRSYDKTFKLRKELFFLYLSPFTFSLIITTNPNCQTANQMLLYVRPCNLF
jgi:hypothetical protein